MPGLDISTWQIVGGVAGLVLVLVLVRIIDNAAYRRLREARGYGGRRRELPEFRQEVKANVKYELLRQHGPVCLACQKTFEPGNLTLDHIIPKSLWLDDPDARPEDVHDIANLQLLCYNCNRIKGARLMPIEQLRAEVRQRSKLKE